MFPNIYRGTEGRSRNLNTFLKLINITVDLTVAQALDACIIVDSTLVQPPIRRLYNR